MKLSRLTRWFFGDPDPPRRLRCPPAALAHRPIKPARMLKRRGAISQALPKGKRREGIPVFVPAPQARKKRPLWSAEHQDLFGRAA